MPHAAGTAARFENNVELPGQFRDPAIFAVYFGKNKIVTIFAHLKTRCGGNRGPGGGIGRHATLRGWWALARVSSSLVLGTTNRFRIISKPVLFFLIVIAYFMTAWDAMHPKPPLREENAGKVQNYKRSRRPRISDRRIRSVSQRHLEENILFPDRNPVILPRLLFRPSVRVSDARLRRGLRW